MTEYNYEQGIQNFLDDGSFLEIVLENIYKSFLHHGDLAIDGGANRGRHTVPMAKCVEESGKVIAIEAIPDLAAALDLRTRLNNLPVKVLSNALADKAGHVEFSYCVDRDWRSGIHARKFLETMNTQVIEVEMVSLDMLVGEESQVSFIKLDLEGGEFDALKGAIGVLERDRPLLVVEHGGVEGANLYGYSNQEYHEFLTGLGYTVIDLLGREMAVERFEKPDVWYFAALDLKNDRHTSLVRNLPAVLIAAAQEFLTENGRRFNAG